jgi:hypothetical protein
MNIYLYKYIYVHSIHMSKFERLNRFDIKIYEVGHQERFAVDGDVISN